MYIVIKITAIIVLFILSIYYYYGGFSKITFKQEISGNEKVVYESTKGDYPATEKASIKISDFLKTKVNIMSSKNYSYYETSPHTTEKNYLKSEGGCILSAKDSIFIPEIEKFYKVRTLPLEKSFVSNLPYKGKISILISAFRLYPKLYRYVKKQGYDFNAPVTEIFDPVTKSITYRMKIIEVKEEAVEIKK